MSKSHHRKFLKILAVELEDLRDHIGTLEEQYRARQKSGEITEHVCNENIALLRNEACCIGECLRVLAQMNPDEHETLNDLARSVGQAFKERIKACGLAQATYFFAEAKIQKVTEYVSAP